jgi:hypothetical protein
MSLADMSLPDLVGTLLGFFLTLMVFSYAFGDNALFRATIHIFIGVSAGYAAIVAWYNVIWPQLFLPLVFGSQSERLYILFPLVLSGLLLFKASPRLSWVGSPAVAYLVGVGVAVGIGGAILGTIFPQTQATINLLDTGAGIPPGGSLLFFVAQGVLIILGTVTTLIYFHFGARNRASGVPKRPEWVEFLAKVGQIFIAITLGVIFAGVFTAALTAMIERVQFISDVILPLLTGQ